MKSWKYFLAGAIAASGIIILGNAAFALSEATNISVYYKNIKILLNGNEIKTAEPFIFNNTAYLSISEVARALEKDVEWDGAAKQILIYDVESFWNKFISEEGRKEGSSLYLRHIDSDIVQKVDRLIEKYGAEVLFEGLKSKNLYSRYYCINRLIEYYNDRDIKKRAINEIGPFLNSENEKLKRAAQFAVNVLEGKSDDKYIISCAGNVKVFALFNEYSDYGSCNELWMIKADKLSRLYAFDGASMYINAMWLSPDKEKLAVRTVSNKSSYINIIDTGRREAGKEIISILRNGIGADKGYTLSARADGENYSRLDHLVWLDNATVEFDVALSYDDTDIIEKGKVKYNILNNTYEYKQ